MKAWIQRVSRASVTIDGERVSEIGQGYLVLLGVTHTDTPAAADKIAARIPVLRLFRDANDNMNLSLEDVKGSVIVVSQFTLYADTAHGRRPGFSAAARPELAEPLYERVVARLRELLGADRVGTGRFGADMKVRLLNDGPFSVELLGTNDGSQKYTVSLDGQSHFPLHKGDIVQISRQPQKLKLLVPPSYDYFATLRAKLRWGER